MTLYEVQTRFKSITSSTIVDRSLYTGSLFQFLQADDNEKEPQTMDEMVAKDYKFYLITSYDDMTKDSVLMRGR